MKAVVGTAGGIVLGRAGSIAGGFVGNLLLPGFGDAAGAFIGDYLEDGSVIKLLGIEMR